MFCKNCGSELKDDGTCPVCASASTEASDAAKVSEGTFEVNEGTTEVKGGTSALKENVAGLLCYLLGWITGIVFLLIDKRPSVQFHALQSILAFGALSLLTMFLNSLFGLFPYTIWRLLSMVNTLISLGSLALAIFLMIQAYGGKQYLLPVVGEIARKRTKGNSK